MFSAVCWKGQLKYSQPLWGHFNSGSLPCLLRIFEMFLHLGWSPPGVNSAERTSFQVTHVYLISHRQYQSQNIEFRSGVLPPELRDRMVRDTDQRKATTKILQKVPKNTEVSISSEITTRTVHCDWQSTNLSNLGDMVLVTQEPSQLQRSWVQSCRRSASTAPMWALW